MPASGRDNWRIFVGITGAWEKESNRRRKKKSGWGILVLEALPPGPKMGQGDSRPSDRRLSP